MSDETEIKIEDPEVKTEVEAVETYHKPGWVFQIAWFSGLLSWFVGLVFLVLTSGQIYDFVSQGGELGQITWLNWLSVVSSVLQGLAFALLLQGVSQGLNLLMDIYEEVQIKK